MSRAEARAELRVIAGVSDESDFVTLDPGPAEVLRARPAPGEAIETAFPTLNRITRGGLQSGIVTIQGPPGVGKTTLSQQLAFDAANARRAAVAALMADEGRISPAIRFGQNAGLDRWKLDVGDEAALAMLETVLKDLPLSLPDPDDTVESVAERIVARWPDLRPILLLDSLQVARVASFVPGEGDGKLRFRIVALMGFLRTFYQTHGGIVLAVSQVNRGAYASKDPAARSNPLAASAESSAIEYGSHLMIHLEGESPYDGITARVVKNRWGTGEKPAFRIRENPDTARFEEIDGLAEVAGKDEARERRLAEIAGRIARNLEKHPEGVNSGTLEEVVARNKRDYLDARDRMEDNGKIRWEERGKETIWFLCSAGEAER